MNGATPTGDNYGRDLSVTVGDAAVPLLVDCVAAGQQAEREFHGDPVRPRSDEDARHVSFMRGVWGDVAPLTTTAQTQIQDRP